MKLLDRYISAEFIKSFAFALLAFSSVLLFLYALEVFAIESRNEEASVYVYLLYSIPGIVTMVLPAALMFAVCFTVAQFTVSREMVAAFSAGRSFFRCVRPIIIFSLFIALGLFVLNDFVVTGSNRLANEEKKLLEEGTSRARERDAVFQSNLRGREGFYFVYYFDRSRQRILGGFHYLEVQGQHPSRMYQAAAVQYQPETQDWKLELVREVIFNPDISIKAIHVYPEKIMRFPEDVEFFSNPSRDPGELNVFELMREIEKREEMGFPSVDYRVQFHSNLSFPLMCIILTIVGSIGGNMGSLRSGGPLIRALLISIITMFVYYLTFSLVNGLGRNAIVPPALASWGPTGAFFAIAGLM
ncbi:MAG: LptF/LptG family permease, partial [Leptospiraceae bacterium]|nr:LptF/LptG family permease [Leptospiraceae bacterium]